MPYLWLSESSLSWSTIIRKIEPFMIKILVSLSTTESWLLMFYHLKKFEFVACQSKDWFLQLKYYVHEYFDRHWKIQKRYINNIIIWIYYYLLKTTLTWLPELKSHVVDIIWIFSLIQIIFDHDGYFTVSFFFSPPVSLSRFHCLLIVVLFLIWKQAFWSAKAAKLVVSTATAVLSSSVVLSRCGTKP